MRQVDVTASIASRLPPVHLERRFLKPSDHAELLRHSVAHELDYEPSQVATYREGQLQEDGLVNEGTRSSGRRSLEPGFRDLFKQGVRDRQETIGDAIGVSFPDAAQFEIEAVHSGDGAFFSRHIDTSLGGVTNCRVISAVYYYFQSPRRFSGGQLKLYSLDQKASVIVEPEDNMMVFFPSIFTHEVLSVSVPSGTFEAGRFSVNCWVNRTT